MAYVIWLVVQRLLLHSKPVFRDDFFLAYNIWGWNLCWVRSALFFPVGFSSNLKIETPIGVPGTSLRNVPSLLGEGINTTHIYVKFISCLCTALERVSGAVTVSKMSLFQMFSNFGWGAEVIKFPIFHKHKIVHIILGGGKKIMDYFHFLWFFRQSVLLVSKRWYAIT